MPPARSEICRSHPPEPVRSLIGALGIAPSDVFRLLQQLPIDHQGICAGGQIGETAPGFKLNV